MNLDGHIQEILRYQKLINELQEHDYLDRLEILSKMLVLIGKIAAHFSEEYKKVYATRKRVYAEAYINAKRSKQAEAELTIVDLREVEAETYGYYKRWTNAFESTKEEINVLKYKIRIDIEDGSSRQGA